MADIWMDVDSALSEVPVNLMPLIDDTDFKTIEDAIAYNAAGMDLRWNFVTSAGALTSTAVTPTTAGTYDWTHQGDGIYTIEIPASGGASINNDTEGYGWFSGKITGVLPFRGPVIGFRAAAMNDSLCDTNTTGILAPTTAGRTLDVTATGAAGIDLANVENQTSTLNLTNTTILNATTTTTAASASAAYPILNGVTVGAGGSSTAIDISGVSPTFANDELNDLLLIIYDDSEAERHSRWIDDYTASTSLCTVAALPFTPESGADLVYIYPIRRDGQKLKATDGMGNQTANITGNLSGSVGSVTGAVGSVTGNVGGNVTGSVGSVVGAVGSVTGNVGGNVVGSVGSVTGNVGGIAGTITTLDALDTAQDTQHGTTQTAIADVPTLSEFNARTLAAADYATSTALGAVDTVVDGIAAVLTGITSLAQWLGLIAGKQTGNTTARTELRATGAGSGTYDEVTDSLEAIKDAGSGGLDAAGVRAAIGLASANLDTQLADLPTVAEFEARTLVAANYFDPAADTVANVTNVATVTTLTNLPAITANWLTAAGIAADAVAEIQSGLATAANLATVAGYLDTEIAAILADTNELQTDWENGGRLDLILDARSSQTSVDALTTTVGAAGAGLTALASSTELAKVPKSDGSATWNATALASIQQEATDALYAAPPSNGAGVAPLSVSYFAMAAFNYTRTDSLLTVKSDDGTTQDTHTLTEDDTLGPVGTITGGA